MPSRDVVYLQGSQVSRDEIESGMYPWRFSPLLVDALGTGLVLSPSPGTIMAQESAPPPLAQAPTLTLPKNTGHGDNDVQIIPRIHQAVTDTETESESDAIKGDQHEGGLWGEFGGHDDVESGVQDDVAESTRTSSGSLDTGKCHESNVEEEHSDNSGLNNQVRRIDRSRRPFKIETPKDRFHSSHTIDDYVQAILEAAIMRKRTA